MANNVDGEIKLGVKLTIADIQKTARDLQKQVSGIFDSIDTSKLDGKTKNILTTLNKLTNESVELARKMEEMANVQVPTEPYKQAESELDKLISKYEGLKAKKEKYLEMGGNKDSAFYEKILSDLGQTETQLEAARDRMQQLVDSGKAFTLGRDSEEYAKMGNKLNDINNKMAVYKTRLAEATKSTKKMSNESSKAFGGMSKALKGGLRQILKYTLGISSLLVLFNKLRAAIKEGINNLVRWRDGNNDANKAMTELTSSLAYLKNSLATAFTPILTAITPILSQFIDLLAQAAEKVGMFLAYITGKSTFVRAKKNMQDYAKSLDGVNDKLGEYDKLSVIGDNDKDATNIANSFEEVPIDSGMMDKWNDLLDTLKEAFANLWEPFKQGFFAALGDIGPRIQTIKDGIGSITQSLIDIFTDPQVVAAMWSWAQSFMNMLGSLVGTVFSIGLTIAANLVGGMAQYLDENKDRIKGFLVDMFNIWEDINVLLAEFFQAFADVFSVFAAENGVNMTAQLIGIFNDAFMGILQLASRLGRDLLELLLKPFIDNKDAIRENLDLVLGIVGDLLAILKDLVDYVVDNVLKMYDEHIKPFVDSVTEGISEIVAILLDGWQKYMKPVWDEIVAMLKVFVEKWVKPLVDEVLGLFGDVIDILKIVWEKWLQPFLKWVAQNIYPVVAPIVSAIAKVVIGMVSVITAGITGIIQTLRAVLTFIKNVFQGDFTGAWEQLKKDFLEIWDSMSKKVEEPMNTMLQGIEDFANRVIDILNKMIDSVNGLHFDLPEWVPLVGGKSLGFTIPHIPNVSIPRLAQGAVIPPNRQFLAMLGDQTSGTNIEAPLETMVAAFKQALSEEGSNHSPIVLQLDGRTIAQVVWDETDKKYKQTGQYIPRYA